MSTKRRAPPSVPRARGVAAETLPMSTKVLPPLSHPPKRPFTGSET